MPPKVIFLILLAALSKGVEASVNVTRSANVNKELILTQKEKIAFQQFKSAVYRNISQEYIMIRQDLYLLRFIRAHSLDVDVARKELFAFMKYIQDNDIMNVLNEDWSDMEDDFPVYYDVVDKEGHPVCYTTTETGWDIRQVVLQGKTQRYIKYNYKMVFEMYLRLVEAAKKDSNLTQFILLMDLNGFSLRQHGCPACIATYIHLLQLYEKWIPGYAREIIIVNSPNTINILVTALRPFLSAQTNSALKIFGTNKARWMSYLQDRIDQDQLDKMFKNLYQLD